MNSLLRIQIKYIILIILMIIQWFHGYLYSDSPFGGLYDPGRKMSIISTKYFDIIFSKESEGTAVYLAGISDSIYERLNGLLVSKHKEKITVVITSDVQTENGLTTLLPYTEIILLDYHIDTAWANEKEYFKDVFTHELTHAISLNIRSGEFEKLSGIFGNYMAPNLTMPEFMIEGVAVSFESLEGNGRVNEPAVQEQIKQDIIENRFKNLSQASGPYDLYPFGNVYYYYGGLFNHYIQDKYGITNYNELWIRNGGDFPYTFPAVFKYIYGSSLFSEWNLFRDYLRPFYYIFNNTNILFPASSQVKLSIRTPGLSKNRIYFCDDFDHDIKYFDPDNKNYGEILDFPGDVSVSEDGKFLLITANTARDGVIKNFTRIYDIEERKFVENSYKYKIVGSVDMNPIGDACFFETGDENEKYIVAIRANGHKSDLVLIKADGSKPETLLYGNESVSYRTPVQLNGNEITYIISDNGNKKIGIYNIKTKEAFVLDIPFIHINSVSACEGRILFNYNDDYSFYKLGIIDGTNMLIETNNISGGVFNPMLKGENIYYTGKFSESDKLMKYPAGLYDKDQSNGYTLIITNCSVIKWDTLMISSGNSNNSDFQFEEKPYNSLPYLLPHFWIPYFTLGNHLIPNSLGFYTVLIDPLFQNMISLYSTYNYFKIFQNINLNWNNTALPLNFNIVFSDTLPYYYSTGDYIRQTMTSLDLNKIYYFFPDSRYFKIGGTISCYQWSPDNGKFSAYYWDMDYNSTISTFYAAFSTSVSKYQFYYNKGYNVTAWFDYNINMGVYKEEINLNAFTSVIPVSFSFNAAYSPWKIFNLGSDNFYFGNNHYSSYYEYQYSAMASAYFIKSDLNMLLFDLEIQQGAWLIPLYFNRIYLTAGYRNAYLNQNYFHSVYSRLSFGSSILYGAVSPSFYIEGYYAITMNGWGFAYNFQLL